MPDVIHDNVATGATRQELIAAMVQRELAAAAKLAPVVFDVSEYAEPGADSIEFPSAGSFTVTKRVEGTPTDAQALVYATDKLDLSEEADVQWVLPRLSRFKSRVDLQATAIRRATSAHGRSVDSDLLTEMLAGAAVGNAVVFNPATIEDNILEMIENLDSQNAPEEDRFLIFKPAQKRQLLGVDNFVQADKYGDRTPILMGEIGQAYGVRFIMTNNSTLPDASMIMMQKEGIALGLGYAAEFDEQKAIEYGAGSRRYALTQLYGVKAMQGGVLLSVAS